MAIAESVELYNHDDALVTIDGDNKLIPVNLDTQRKLIGEQIAEIRITV